MLPNKQEFESVGKHLLRTVQFPPCAAEEKFAAESNFSGALSLSLFRSAAGFYAGRPVHVPDFKAQIRSARVRGNFSVSLQGLTSEETSFQDPPIAPIGAIQVALGDTNLERSRIADPVRPLAGSPYAIQ